MISDLTSNCLSSRFIFDWDVLNNTVALKLMIEKDCEQGMIK